VNRIGHWPSPAFPRVVPASDDVLAAYGDYQAERSEVVGMSSSDMVLVNLYHEPLGRR